MSGSLIERFYLGQEPAEHLARSLPAQGGGNAITQQFVARPNPAVVLAERPMAAIPGMGPPVVLPEENQRMRRSVQMVTDFAAPFAGSTRAAVNVPARLEALRSWATEAVPGLKLWAAQDGNTGAIRLSQIVVPEGQRGAGIGSEVMRRLVALADEAGVPVALSPDGSWGGSVPRLKRFYSGFGFKPNTGRSRDLSISETMIRPPGSQP